MSEDVAKYYTDPEEMFFDSFVRLWRSEGADVAVMIGAILETEVSMRKIYRAHLEWEKRLFNKNPEAYRRNIERRLQALLAGGGR